MSDSEFKLGAQEKNGIPIFQIQGEITGNTENQISKLFQQYRSLNHQNFIIDFSKTSYINSAGIAVLIKIISDISDHGGRICYVGLSNHFQKIMDIVGLTDFVEIYSSENDALVSLGK